MEEMNMGHSVPISLSIQREERINHDKTQQLMKQLKEIEKNEVRTNCENVEVDETKNEEQSNETIEHLPNSEIRRSQRNQIIGKKDSLFSTN